MDRGAWRATVHGVAQSWTRLSMQMAHQNRDEKGVCTLSVEKEKTANTRGGGDVAGRRW